jgi:hypothetical protein
MLPPIDLTQTTQAMLRLSIYFDIEEYFDGFVVQASTDGGITWELLIPLQGYTGSVYVFESDPGFTGLIHAWWPVAFDLSNLTGHSVLLAFEFGSDGSVTYSGAAIDDILITASAPADTVQSDAEPIPGFIPPVWQPAQPESFEAVDIPWARAVSMVNCREGTNQAFPILTTLNLGQSVPIKALNPDRSWLLVLDLEDHISCWVWSELMEVPEDLGSLAILPDEIPPDSLPEDHAENGTGPVCHDSLPAPECTAAGGTPQLVGWPPCVCP